MSKIVAVTVHELEVKIIIGITPESRIKKSKVLIDFSVKFDAAKGIKTDNVKDVWDYVPVIKKMTKDINKKKYFLLETLADFILKELMKDKRIMEATVNIRKVRSKFHTKAVSVELTSKR